MKPIRVLTLFSGYDSQLLALKRLRRDFPQFDYEPVAICEIDRYAVQAHKAVHGDIPNLGDISKVDWNAVPDFDLATWSFPCTDISTVGKMQGLSENSGTRSSLAYEALKCFEAKRPKYLLMENVANLVKSGFIKDFHALCLRLEAMGYENHAKVLNSMNFGVPQSRQRVFMVSILGGGSFNFPASLKLNRHLIDIMEPEVEERFYIDLDRETLNASKIKERLKYLTADAPFYVDTNFNNKPMKNVSGTILSEVDRCGHCYVSEPVDRPVMLGNFCKRKTYQCPQEGAYYYANGVAPAVIASHGGKEPKALEGFRIRKLTPRECFRLMDVEEPDIDKIQAAGISESQQYKMAGNSIVVAVLYHIFRKLFIETENEHTQQTLF